MGVERVLVVRQREVLCMVVVIMMDSPG